MSKYYSAEFEDIKKLYHKALLVHDGNYGHYQN